MGTDLGKIKEAISAIKGMATVYSSLKYAEEALCELGNLESSRLQLEPKIEALKEERTNLNAEIEELRLKKEKAAEDLRNLVIKNSNIAAEHLATAMIDVEKKAEKYANELGRRLGEHKDAVAKAEEELVLLNTKCAAAQTSLARLQADAETEQTRVDQLKAKSEQLKAQARQLADL